LRNRVRAALTALPSSSWVSGSPPGLLGGLAASSPAGGSVKAPATGSQPAAPKAKVPASGAPGLGSLRKNQVPLKNTAMPVLPVPVQSPVAGRLPGEP
jgi:hypothetical protein